MGRHEIELDGAEITVLKAIGLGGTFVDGKSIYDKCKGLNEKDIIESLQNLIALGYVNTDNEVFYSMSDIKTIDFQANPNYSKELKSAMDERPEQKESKRIRRE